MTLPSRGDWAAAMSKGILQELIAEKPCPQSHRVLLGKRGGAKQLGPRAGRLLRRDRERTRALRSEQPLLAQARPSLGRHAQHGGRPRHRPAIEEWSLAPVDSEGMAW